MKSPRHWALQHYVTFTLLHSPHSRNEKPETLGIATFLLRASLLL